MRPRMRRGGRTGAEQLELLGPRPQLPLWSGLPASVQREVTRLLARLMRGASQRGADDTREEEAGHE
jgi:hypothetical protein